MQNVTAPALTAGVSNALRLGLTCKILYGIMNDNNSNGHLGDISRTAKEYVNLRLDEFRLKGVENFSIISNKVLVILIATMLGAVVLQLLGFAFAFFIGDLLGSIALGFIIMAALFGCALAAIYVKRDTMFINKMIQMYMKMFFGNAYKQEDEE